jgi:FlaG/FlaF family flagellin (archaellin)
MQVHALFRRDDAVSPVIGVILMVAITVIMAAVVGGFLVGIDSGDAAPQSTWETDEITDGNGNAVAVEITHTGGSTIDPETVGVSYSGDFDYETELKAGNITVLYPGNSLPTSINTTVSPPSNPGVAAGQNASTADPIQAGDTVTICFVRNTDVASPPPAAFPGTRNIEDADASGENLRVFWSASGSSNSRTLGTHELSNPIKGDFDAAVEHCNYSP